MRKRPVIALFLFSFFVLPAMGMAGLWLATPDASSLSRNHPERTQYMLLRAQEQGLPDHAFSLHWIALDEVSPLLICSVVKAEDTRFFRHQGVEWGETRRLAWKWLTGSIPRGGSTISQQLARNLYLSPDRNAVRKLRELFAAHELEQTLDKRRILELYLNTAEWAEGVWGIRNASLHFFSKEPSALDAFESAFLVSLLPAPRQPLLGSNVYRAFVVQSRVLAQLRASGLLDTDEYQRGQTRVRTLYKQLLRGQKVEELLSAGPEARGTLPHYLEVDEVLRQECGLEQERAAAKNTVAPPSFGMEFPSLPRMGREAPSTDYFPAR
ncbi:transglycosylase domain-containing protein [Corallococcus sp. M7]